jgi:sugar O-acyltransferase (sialic acid O-acetyltransferase NeuD family)
MNKVAYPEEKKAEERASVILIGAGGHCKACIDVIEQENKFRIGGLVDVQDKLHEKILSYEIIATDEDLPRLVNEYPYFLITLGQLQSPQKRISFFNFLKKMGADFPVIISPLAYVSRHASIGKGTIVMHQALVNAGARVGMNCIVNSKSLIEHDAAIADHCHIATGAVVNGGTHIAQQTFVGSNAVIKEYIKIGKSSIIGAGAVIIENVPGNTTVIGMPAKNLKTTVAE